MAGAADVRTLEAVRSQLLRFEGHAHVAAASLRDLDVDVGWTARANELEAVRRVFAGEPDLEGGPAFDGNLRGSERKTLGCDVNHPGRRALSSGRGVNDRYREQTQRQNGQASHVQSPVAFEPARAIRTQNHQPSPTL